MQPAAEPDPYPVGDRVAAPVEHLACDFAGGVEPRGQQLAQPAGERRAECVAGRGLAEEGGADGLVHDATSVVVLKFVTLSISASQTNFQTETTLES